MMTMFPANTGDGGKDDDDDNAGDDVPGRMKMCCRDGVFVINAKAKKKFIA